jgi:hypothetical protein
LALQVLERTLILAEPEGFVRLFVNEGELLAALLRKMKVESKRMTAYRARLLAAFRTDRLLTLAESPIPSIELDQLLRHHPCRKTFERARIRSFAPHGRWIVQSRYCRKVGRLSQHSQDAGQEHLQ